MSEIIKQINFLKSQRWIDLTHQVTKDIPYFPSFSPIEEETLFTVESDGFFAKNKGLLGELYWLSQNKYQVEVLANLDQVPATGAAIFIGFPKIADAPGFNARVFAICPE